MVADAAASELYIGAMSGTSTDGVDAVLVDLSNGWRPDCLRARAHVPFNESLTDELLELNTPGPNELHRAALATRRLAAMHADAVRVVLRHAGVTAAQVVAIGAHGQTVRHRPGEFDGFGYTWQLDPGPILSALCGIDVVSDFRSQDVALGGQGAPLVPMFHDQVFRQPDRSVAVLNLGGMANLTGLVHQHATVGFDVGPGNVLLDLWCRQHRGEPYDEDGAWGATGRAIDSLLAVWLGEPFFSCSPPKSTGRDLFDAAWLQRGLDRWRQSNGSSEPAPADVQATLAELTACTVASALRWVAASPAVAASRIPRPNDLETLWVCGGGALNRDLMSRLARRIPGSDVRSTSEGGLDPTAVEACAFAWFARQRIKREPTTLIAVTGAREAAVSGAWRSRPAG